MKKIALVLGGGGMRGMSHIGVLKSLAKRGIKIDHYIGSSIGALVSSFAASGLSPAEIEETALSIKRADILDFHFFDLVRHGFRQAWIYRGDRLRDYVRKTLPTNSFDEMKSPLFINSVNINTGQLIYWGLPSFRYVPVADAVTASCSYPTAFKPKKIKADYYIDGGIIDNLPIKVTRYTKPDLIIAVNLRYRGVLNGKNIEKKGIISLIDQSSSMMSQKITDYNLQVHKDLPIVMIQPNVGSYDFLDFNNTKAMIDEGERAADEVFDKHPLFGSENGKTIFSLLFKDKPIFEVDAELCTGCASCIVHCPTDLYKITDMKASYLKSQRDRCIACLECIKNCPYKAISFAGEKETFTFSNLQHLQSILWRKK